MRKTRTTDGAAIRARRTELGLTLVALAARTDVSVSYLKHLELYGYQASDRILVAIARGLRCRLDDVSTRIEQRDAA